jgi:hypothetical protein
MMASPYGRHRNAGNGGWSSWSTQKRMVVIGGVCVILFMLYTMMTTPTVNDTAAASQRLRTEHVHTIPPPDDGLPIDDLPLAPVVGDGGAPLSPMSVNSPQPIAAAANGNNEVAREMEGTEVVWKTKQGRSPVSTRVQILAETPHDPSAFTQGLCFYRGELYESTGLNGRSTLRKVDLKTGILLLAD